MKLTPVPNPLDEPIYEGVAASGLRVRVNPRPRHRRTFAAFGVDFGAIDRRTGDGAVVPAGLAHFLEHKLFEDADGDVSDRFALHGADANASTGYSTTSYVFSTSAEPAPCLELLLRFVQDPYFTDELVAKEQGIIAQEIGMYDDDPDWRQIEGLMQCLFARHPARDNIAGTVESIAEIDAATLRRCYDAFYHPRNMCLSVAGRLDADTVAALVEADQAPRGRDESPPNRRAGIDEAPRAHEPRCELRMPVARPRLLLGFKDAAVDGDGRAVRRRELTSRLLLDMVLGRSSPAFERLYEDGLVDETFSVSHMAEDGFGVALIGGDTDEPDRLEQRLREILADARAGRFERGAHARTRHKVLGSMLRGLDSLESVAYSLLVETFRGLAPMSAPAIVESITIPDVERRAEELLREEALAIACLRPV